MRLRLIAGLALVVVSTMPAAASAQTFVGSWTVDQGPSWTTFPQEYSGQAAAALLFGGSPSDYFISTIDNLAADINHMAWYSTFGGACDGNSPCGTQYAEGFTNDQFYSNEGDVSSYVQDWAYGEQYTNYAFLADEQVAAPEPASLVLLATGLVGIGGIARRRRTS